MSGYTVTLSTFDELDAWFQTMPSTTKVSLIGNPLIKPRSPVVEAWLAALKLGDCDVIESE